ncbi:hypothetical protein ALC57_07444 [Trachymyrmex cornetzi]|uniref:Uncharacterized protein n=1 Tax=Trachymyrmex cornetzi TaxID=471704 RepID=A0A195E5M9_9HYME|nr:hypothetical protein ALC57_07444 [Trachymyrmex cornetzi]
MCVCVIQRRKKANDRGQGRGAVAAGLKKAVERRSISLFCSGLYNKFFVIKYIMKYILLNKCNKYLRITFLSSIRIQVTILQVAARVAPHFTPRYTSRRDRVEWEEIPNSIISYNWIVILRMTLHVILSGLAGSFKPPRRFSAPCPSALFPPRPRTSPLALAVAAAGADTAYTGTEGKKIGETRKGANERRGQRAIGGRGKQHRTWYPRVAEWALVFVVYTRSYPAVSRRVFGINATNVAAATDEY